MRRKPYPAYKDSGIEWLGDVPEHWEVKRTRFMLSMNPSKQEIRHLEKDSEVSFLPMEAVGENGSLNLEATRPISEVISGYTYFAEEDVTFAKITPCFENGKGAIMRGLTGSFGFGTTELTVLRPGQMLNKKYLFYLTIAREFRKNGEAWMYGAGGQKRVPDEFVKEFRFAFPSLLEQEAIAAFLDRETERIDILIAKKERQIELLQEKRTVLISHAVTKGLDPNARMKNSSIEWIGKVPSHWDVIRLKYALWLQRGHDLPITEFQEGEYPVCGSNGCIGYHNQYTTNGPGVIVGRSGSVGEVNYVNTNYWAHNTALYVKEFRRTIPRYAFYLLKALDVKYLGEGTAVGTLNRNNIHDLPIVIPKMIEQDIISTFLDRETAQIDTLVKKMEGSINILREYRTALISAAVTGKIDIHKESKE